MRERQSGREKTMSVNDKLVSAVTLFMMIRTNLHKIPHNELKSMNFVTTITSTMKSVKGGIQLEEIISSTTHLHYT